MSGKLQAQVIENVRLHLRKRRLKQKDMAKFMGVRPQYVNGLLTGKKVFRFSDLESVAGFLGLSPNQLVMEPKSGDEIARRARAVNQILRLLGLSVDDLKKSDRSK